MSASSIRKLNQAEERLQQGDVPGAQFLCEQVLQRAPRNPDALSLLGLCRLIGGQPADAAPLFERALSTEPRHGLALEHLGLAHLLLGRFQDAEAVLRRAAALPGAPASVFMRLGLAVLYQERPDEAVRHLRHACDLDPQNTDCLLNLGQALAKLGDPDAARSQFETVLRLDPGHVDAMRNLGVIALDRDALDEAGAWFERALDRSPRYAEALASLGIVRQKQGRLDDAIACFRRALEISPALAPAGNNLARTLFLQGRLEESLEQYRTTLRLAPDLLEANEGLAFTCLTLGRFKEGIARLHEVLRLDPQNRNAWTSLADALFQCNELDEAASAAKRANEIDPDAAGPYSVTALVHIVRRELDQAIAVLETGCQRTGATSLLGMLTHQLRRTCDWDKWNEVWRGMALRLDRTAELGSPFWLLAEDTSAEQQLSYTRRWSEARFPAAASDRGQSGSGAQRPSHQRVRIGYLSSDFHEHATAYLLAGVLERHDRDRFEIFAYSYGPDDASPMRARLRRACEHFADVAWDPDDVVVRRIRDDALDILVDLKGYTLGARTSILARRPCPIQVNWLGYPGTMGARFIDHLITDGFIVPPGREAAYSERVLRLSHCWQCNDRSRPALDPLSRGEYGLPGDGIVFCCFTQSVKITPEVFARWMSLLRRVPGSVLWLAEDNPWATTNLKKAAQAHGIESGRLVFSPRLPLPQHLARYRVADLALDTFPYTSHSTASDGLWSGCPLVALCGNTFAARVSGSILTHANLPDLITYSLDDYETLAFRLATDAAALGSIRSRVAAAQASSLFDAESFARDLERLYLDIVKRARD